MPSAFLVLATGVKGEKFMHKHIQYHDEPMGNPQPVADFLPPAASLTKRQPPSDITSSMGYHKVAEPSPPAYQV